MSHSFAVFTLRLLLWLLGRPHFSCVFSSSLYPFHHWSAHGSDGRPHFPRPACRPSWSLAHLDCPARRETDTLLGALTLSAILSFLQRGKNGSVFPFSLLFCLKLIELFEVVLVWACGGLGAAAHLCSPASALLAQFLRSRPAGMCGRETMHHHCPLVRKVTD